MKASAFIATSLDGFIARSDHRLDWLEEADSDATQDYGYEAFIAQVSTVVMGRKTYEKILTFPEWPFPHKRFILLSNSIKTVPDELADQIQIYKGDVKELVDILDAEGDIHLYVDGSQVIHSFLMNKLLTDITITTLPVLIGEGIPLFKMPLIKDLRLKHETTQVYNNGFIQTHYTFL